MYKTMQKHTHSIILCVVHTQCTVPNVICTMYNVQRKVKYTLNLYAIAIFYKSASKVDTVFTVKLFKI